MFISFEYYDEITFTNHLSGLKPDAKFYPDISILIYQFVMMIHIILQPSFGSET